MDRDAKPVPGTEAAEEKTSTAPSWIEERSRADSPEAIKFIDEFPSEDLLLDDYFDKLEEMRKSVVKAMGIPPEVFEAIRIKERIRAAMVRFQ